MGFRSSCPLHVCSFVQHSPHLCHANYLKISYPSKLVQLSIIVVKATEIIFAMNHMNYYVIETFDFSNVAVIFKG